MESGTADGITQGIQIAFGVTGSRLEQDKSWAGLNVAGLNSTEYKLPKQLIGQH